LKAALQQSLLTGVSVPATERDEDHWEISAEIRELVPFFLDRRQADLDAIKRFLAEENFDGITALAHNIKGSSASYGFPELSRLGAQMEDAGRRRNKPLLERQIADFRALLSTLPASITSTESALRGRSPLGSSIQSQRHA
jgi:HPt (histidine-containing phosphotransfer) domain-containing protein